jgi:hypothetical protein
VRTPWYQRIDYLMPLPQEVALLMSEVAQKSGTSGSFRWLYSISEVMSGSSAYLTKRSVST